MKKLYGIDINCGRMGSIVGRFVCEDSEWEEFKTKYSGRSFWLHDYLGKHSEIEIKIDELEPEVITDDQDFLNRANELKINLGSGFDPFDYIDYLEDE